MIHEPVLLEESLQYLVTNPDGIYFDGTVGFGGHSSEILNKISKNGILIATDKDQIAYDYCKDRFRNDLRMKLFKTGFDDINVIAKIEFIESFDGIFADLGVSSFQLDNKEAGFTYREDGPLDMRMDKSKGISAKEIVNDFDEKEIADIIYQYGEEKKSRQIASAIIRTRNKKVIKTTCELSEIVKSVIKGKNQTSSLSRVFQAFRIYVNNEIEELGNFIEKAAGLLKPGGRLVFLTYHSLEDRVVKNFFKTESSDCICPAQYPVCVCNHKKSLKILTKKPVTATEKEIEKNIRARSAKLRAAEKL